MFFSKKNKLTPHPPIMDYNQEADEMYDHVAQLKISLGELIDKLDLALTRSAKYDADYESKGDEIVHTHSF